MDLETLITGILNFGDMPALLKALKERARKQVFQPFFDEGHGVATAEAATREKQLTDDLDAEKKKAADAQKALDDWKKANPDVAVVHQQYADQIKDLEDKHKDELSKRDKAEAEREVERTKKAIVAHLISKGVDPLIAKAAVKDDEVHNRIKPNTKQGTVQLLQKGKTIPIAEPDVDKAIAAFGDELLEDIPDTYISSNVQRGSGRGTATGGADGKGGKVAEVLEDVKADVRRKFGRDDDGESKKDRRSARERLNDRLGIRTVS